MKEAPMRVASPYLSSAIWFLAGGIAGAGVGLLLAPRSGRSTRQMMARTVVGGADSARELKDRVVSRGEQIWTEAAQRMEDAASSLSGNAERTHGKEGGVPAA
jgi:gas vesicle protein